MKNMMKHLFDTTIPFLILVQKVRLNAKSRFNGYIKPLAKKAGDFKPLIVSGLNHLNLILNYFLAIKMPFYYKWFKPLNRSGLNLFMRLNVIGANKLPKLNY